MAVSFLDTVRVAAELVLPDGVRALNVYYFRRADGSGLELTDAAAVEMLGDRVEVGFNAVAPSVSSAVTLTLTKSDIVEWNAATETWEVVRNLPDYPIGASGLNNGEMLPHQSAAVVVADTDKVRCSPKKFLAGFVETAQDAGRWTSGVLAQLAQFGLAWQNLVTLGDIFFIPGTLSIDGTLRQLGAMFVNAVVGSQRRRKIGSGM